MLNNEKNQKVLGVIIVILLAGLIGWYIVRDISFEGKQEIEEGSLKSLVESGKAQVQEIPVPLDVDADTAMVQPKLNRVVTIPDRFPPEAVQILRSNIATLTTQLKENPDSFESWSDLATQYKIIDDFAGAVEIWEYLGRITKDNTGSRINLGNVYHFQLREFEKSEAVFKEVLAIRRDIAESYTGLYELYRYSYKTDTTLAVDILKEGVVAIPKNIDLRMLLASYHTTLEQKDEAKKVYEEVLTMARNVNNSNLVTIIEAALESLK